VLFLRTELRERNHQIFSWSIKRNSLHKFTGIAWWINRLYLLRAPELVHVTTCPARIGCYLVSILAAKLVKRDQNTVIMNLDIFLRALCFVIELNFFALNIIEHIAAHDWVMCIAVNRHSEEPFHEWIGETHSHCVYKNVARCHT
jgi:hypothetical protein